MLLLPLFFGIAAQAPITTQSLLQEMSDLNRLTRRSPFAYRTVEASSYDRHSVSPTQDGWFANGDYGQYIRTENNAGREEFVMADFKGPGAVVRFWSANPMGIVRFYFDGEETPRLTAKMNDLLKGKVAPWGDAFSYDAAHGCNIYFPFAFAHSFKATVARENPNDRLNGLYYQFNTRLYDESAPVQTFAMSEVGTPRFPAFTNKFDSDSKIALKLKANGSAHVSLKATSPSQIRRLSFSTTDQFPTLPITDPKSAENLLKHIEVCLAFDGQESVRVPLPDLVGAGALPGKLDTLVSSAHGTKSLTLNLPMPYQKSAVITLINHNKVPLSIIVEAGVVHHVASDYVLHAQWSMDAEHSRPMRDMDFVNFKGEGRYVGTVLHVQNPTPAWWGEGDEKVWVDDESFPSWIGTGTEDYFGYAWSNPEVFSRAYHGQARADGPGCGGQVGNVRWHIMDDIPFTKHIDFKLEMWHWEDVASRFDKTSFWYAKPGTWKAPAINALLLNTIDGPKPKPPIKGGIEGEKMKIARKTGGVTEVQDFAELSAGKQLWWRDGKDGDSLELSFKVAKAGTYHLVANCCKAVDYGIHELFLNGVSLGTRDFYNAGLKWEVLDLGTVKVSAGTATLKVVLKGSNPKSVPARRMFGLDYILLKS